MTTHCWGEEAAGEWSLEIQDTPSQKRNDTELGLLRLFVSSRSYEKCIKPQLEQPLKCRPPGTSLSCRSLSTSLLFLQGHWSGGPWWFTAPRSSRIPCIVSKPGRPRCQWIVTSTRSTVVSHPPGTAAVLNGSLFHFRPQRQQLIALLCKRLVSLGGFHI